MSQVLIAYKNLCSMKSILYTFSTYGEQVKLDYKLDIRNEKFCWIITHSTSKNAQRKITKIFFLARSFHAVEQM